MYHTSIKKKKMHPKIVNEVRLLYYDDNNDPIFFVFFLNNSSATVNFNNNNPKAHAFLSKFKFVLEVEYFVLSIIDDSRILCFRETFKRYTLR